MDLFKLLIVKVGFTFELYFISEWSRYFEHGGISYPLHKPLTLAGLQTSLKTPPYSGCSSLRLAPTGHSFCASKPRNPKARNNKTNFFAHAVKVMSSHSAPSEQSLNPDCCHHCQSRIALIINQELFCFLLKQMLLSGNGLSPNTFKIRTKLLVGQNIYEHFLKENEEHKYRNNLQKKIFHRY